MSHRRVSLSISCRVRFAIQSDDGGIRRTYKQSTLSLIDWHMFIWNINYPRASFPYMKKGICRLLPMMIYYIKYTYYYRRHHCQPVTVVAAAVAAVSSATIQHRCNRPFAYRCQPLYSDVASMNCCCWDFCYDAITHDYDWCSMRVRLVKRVHRSMIEQNEPIPMTAFDRRHCSIRQRQQTFLDWNIRCRHCSCIHCSKKKKKTSSSEKQVDCVHLMLVCSSRSSIPNYRCITHTVSTTTNKRHKIEVR